MNNKEDFDFKLVKLRRKRNLRFNNRYVTSCFMCICSNIDKCTNDNNDNKTNNFCNNSADDVIYKRININDNELFIVIKKHSSKNHYLLFSFKEQKCYSLYLSKESTLELEVL